MDAYRPAAASDVVGDVAAAAHVRDWLGAWRAHIAAEATGPERDRADADKGGQKRGPGRPKKKPRKLPRTESSDEDFENDFENDFDDESRDGLNRYVPLVDARGVPATGALLCGPSGACKTACAYAAAREMGFTVLEVNASRKRSGAEILAQFSEATQSRGLAQGAGGMSKSGMSKSGAARNAKTSAAGFFGARAPRDESDKSGDETSKKRAAPDDDHDTHASPKTQNTLILFEEVDVLRGEDRGFMAALATLIRTTKRPIALTSNATSLPGLAGSGAETVAGVGAEGLPLARVRFKAPSAADASAYASLVASAEGVAVPPAAVAAAAAPDESGNGNAPAATCAARCTPRTSCRSRLFAAGSLREPKAAPRRPPRARSAGGRAAGRRDGGLGTRAARGVRAGSGAEGGGGGARFDATRGAAGGGDRGWRDAPRARRAGRRRGGQEGAPREERGGETRDARDARRSERRRPDAARGETKPVPEPETEEARRGARCETTKFDKIRAEAAAMGIQLVVEGDFEKGSESDKSDHLEARGSVGGSAEKDAADAARDADDDADDDDADDDAEEDDAEEDDAEDSRRPADGWRRAVAEMARLASLADAFSAADAMRRPAAVGASARRARRSGISAFRRRTTATTTAPSTGRAPRPAAGAT